jgi:hypothetical protein
MVVQVVNALAIEYFAGPGVTVELKNDGSAFFKGVITASTVYGSTIATSATIGATGAGSGFKLAGQWLDLFTQGVTAEGVRFYYAPDAITAFSEVGRLAAANVAFLGGSQTVLKATNFVGLELETTGNSWGYGLILSNYTSAPGNHIISRIARGTPGSPTLVQQFDITGEWAQQAYDGTQWLTMGGFSFAVESAAANTIKGRLDLTLPYNGGTWQWGVGGGTDYLTFGAIVVPPKAAGTVAAHGYGTIPVKIAEIVLGASATNVSFTSIPAGFRHLNGHWGFRGDNAAPPVLNLTLNSDTAAHYQYGAWDANTAGTSVFFGSGGGTSIRIGSVTGSTSGAGMRAGGHFRVLDYASTSLYRQVVFTGFRQDTSAQACESGAGSWSDTAAAVSTLTLTASANNLVSGGLATLAGEP